MKHRKAKKRRGWTKLEKIEMECISVNLKNVGPLCYGISVYTCVKMSLTHLENHSVVIWP